MVLRKTYQRKAIAKSRRAAWVFLVSVFAILLIIGVVLLIEIGKNKNNTSTPQEGAHKSSEITGVAFGQVLPSDPALPSRIDYRDAIDIWAKSTGGRKGVVIYDLDRNELVGTYNPQESFQTASLYKLFVVYESYRRLQTGEWQSDDYAGLTGYTIQECLDLSIRQSYSPCAETLWSMIGRKELERIVRDEYGISDSDINSLVSTPLDVAKMMHKYYVHSDITNDELLSLMKDSFLNQPITEYDWRQGLPSGFSKATVYNKVGWDYDGDSWNVYNDAAIVEFPEQNRHYIVVVMTNQIPFQYIRNLGSEIEAVFYSSF